MIMNTYYIEEILPVGEEGMQQVVISKKGRDHHGACVTVIGVDLTEAIQRAVKVLAGLNA
jgi:hypothetical protein